MSSVVAGVGRVGEECRGGVGDSLRLERRGTTKVGIVGGDFRRDG